MTAPKSKIKTKSSKATQSNFWHKSFRYIKKGILFFFGISILWVLIDWFLPVYLTPLMCIRTVESIVSGESPQNEKSWVSIEEISPNIVQAVVASEDNRFMMHNGFSFKDMNRAFKSNQKGKKVRGGSTISQQTAKNVFLFPQRSYIRKGLEAYFTLLIELTWGKKRIMEMYLNVIEMGDGIYGIEAASQIYFHKSAYELTKSESALIAACIPNPHKFHVDNPSSYIRGRQSKILSLMGKIGRVNLDKKYPPRKHRKPK
jgi:monofunctional biosynthetic peptidoglycan transglycosylase